MVTDVTIQKLISRTLRYGVISSALLMLAGFLAYAFTSSPIPMPPDSSAPTLWAFFLSQPLGVTLTHPYFLLYTGILVLLCTPILRVMVAIVMFGFEKEWRFVWVSSLILLIIIVSITVAAYE